MQVLKYFFLTPGVIITGILLLCGLISIIIGKIIGYHSRTPDVSNTISCFMWGLFLGPVGWLIVLFLWRRQQHLKRLQSLILALDDKNARKSFCQKDIAHLVRLLKRGILIFKARKVILWIDYSTILIVIFCLISHFIFINLLIIFLMVLIFSSIIGSYVGLISELTGKSEYWRIIDYEYDYPRHLFKKMGELLKPAEDLLRKLQEKQAYFQ